MIHLSYDYNVSVCLNRFTQSDKNLCNWMIPFNSSSWSSHDDFRKWQWIYAIDLLNVNIVVSHLHIAIFWIVIKPPILKINSLNDFGMCKGHITYTCDYVKITRCRNRCTNISIFKSALFNLWNKVWKHFLGNPISKFLQVECIFSIKVKLQHLKLQL